MFWVTSILGSCTLTRYLWRCYNHQDTMSTQHQDVGNILGNCAKGDASLESVEQIWLISICAILFWLCLHSEYKWRVGWTHRLKSALYLQRLSPAASLCAILLWWDFCLCTQTLTFSKLFFSFGLAAILYKYIIVCSTKDQLCPALQAVCVLCWCLPFIIFVLVFPCIIIFHVVHHWYFFL